jgi:hypothetical protein
MVDQPSDTPPIASQNPAALPLREARWFTSGDIDWLLKRERLKRAADVLLASALIVFTFPLAATVVRRSASTAPGRSLPEERDSAATVAFIRSSSLGPRFPYRHPPLDRIGRYVNSQRGSGISSITAASRNSRAC